MKPSSPGGCQQAVAGTGISRNCISVDSRGYFEDAGYKNTIQVTYYVAGKEKGTCSDSEG
jgi:hypothetical protein